MLSRLSGREGPGTGTGTGTGRPAKTPRQASTAAAAAAAAAASTLLQGDLAQRALGYLDAPGVEGVAPVCRDWLTALGGPEPGSIWRGLVRRSCPVGFERLGDRMRIQSKEKRARDSGTAAAAAPASDVAAAQSSGAGALWKKVIRLHDSAVQRLETRPDKPARGAIPLLSNPAALLSHDAAASAPGSRGQELALALSDCVVRIDFSSLRTRKLWLTVVSDGIDVGLDGNGDEGAMIIDVGDQMTDYRAVLDEMGGDFRATAVLVHKLTGRETVLYDGEEHDDGAFYHDHSWTGQKYEDFYVNYVFAAMYAEGSGTFCPNFMEISSRLCIGRLGAHCQCGARNDLRFNEGRFFATPSSCRCQSAGGGETCCAPTSPSGDRYRLSISFYCRTHDESESDYDVDPITDWKTVCLIARQGLPSSPSTTFCIRESWLDL